MTANPAGSDQPDALHGSHSLAAAVVGHWPAVYKLLWMMSGNSHDAEELTQETFLRAWERLDRFGGDGQLRAWLLRIASNAYFDLLRKRKRSKTVHLEEDLVANETPQPGQRLETAEQYALLTAAMAQLSPTTRTVFHLRAAESLSFRQIGQMLEISEEAARWHMHQARTRLLPHVTP